MRSGIGVPYSRSGIFRFRVGVRNKVYDSRVTKEGSDATWGFRKSRYHHSVKVVGPEGFEPSTSRSLRVIL